MSRPTAEAHPLGIVRGAGQAAGLLHRARGQLLAQLAEPESAAGLARRLGMSRQRVNYHLRELERAGLVELVEERRKGNCVERMVRATARSFVISPEALGALGDTRDAAADRFSVAYLVGAAAAAIRDVAALEAGAREAGKRIATLTIDVDVRFASAAARAAFTEELSATVSQLAARYHDEHARGGRRFRWLTLVRPVPDAATTAPSPVPAGSKTRRTRS
jgi:DNA-binding transcriptional ArsR family regulator